MAYPYAIRGFIFEVNKNPKQAVTFYQKFIDLAPDEPETKVIRSRMEDIQNYGDYE